MKIDIFTLFPEMFAPLEASIMKRACEKGLASIDVHNIRSYADDPHFADDEVYGGGAGMVLKPEPIMKALESRGYRPGHKVIVTTPAGKIFDQAEAAALSSEERIFIIAGHYEGIDQRVTELTGADEYSIGDYVLTGGELPAMVMTDAIVRLLDGVLGDATSLEQESFNEGLVEQPQYTRPREFRGLFVPEELLSGDHRVIEKWRRRESLKRTWLHRPDMLAKVPLGDEDKEVLKPLMEKKRSQGGVYVALVHYPVLDPKGRVIATSVTNLDIHDIARLSATYGVEGYYLIQPGEEQKHLVEQLISYWTKGHGSKVNPDRKFALDKVKVVDSLAEAAEDIQKQKSEAPISVATSAKPRPGVIGYNELSDKMERDDNQYLLIFGTGHGLADEILDRADYVLKPIEGAGEYNHLSVRSAVSIVIDRLIKEN
ncbi:MAG: tRNA (guanosine(37)-N1)-methyltransferase TrmD [Bacillota bacterium]|nr:tRNA (guanosine(37)-N1)-methyltransferase TrmD [Bacillota bacterium]